MFGNIQEGISKNKNDSFYNELKINEYSSFEEIQNPIHISYLKNLTLDDITKDDKKEDRRKNSGFHSNSSLISGISMESLLDNKTFGNKGRSSSNFMNLLQSIHGLGVSPFKYEFTNFDMTVFLNSSLKLKT